MEDFSFIGFFLDWIEGADFTDQVLVQVNQLIKYTMKMRKQRFRENPMKKNLPKGYFLTEAG